MPRKKNAEAQKSNETGSVFEEEISSKEEEISAPEKKVTRTKKSAAISKAQSGADYILREAKESNDNESEDSDDENLKNGKIILTKLYFKYLHCFCFKSHKLNLFIIHFFRR